MNAFGRGLVLPGDIVIEQFLGGGAGFGLEQGANQGVLGRGISEELIAAARAAGDSCPSASWEYS